MFKVGEETGTLDQQLEVASIYFDRELESRIKKFTTMFEPMMIIFVGVIVGFVAVALVQAMYGVLGGAKKACEVCQNFVKSFNRRSKPDDEWWMPTDRPWRSHADGRGNATVQPQAERKGHSLSPPPTDATWLEPDRDPGLDGDPQHRGHRSARGARNHHPRLGDRQGRRHRLRIRARRIGSDLRGESCALLPGQGGCPVRLRCGRQS